MAKAKSSHLTFPQHPYIIFATGDWDRNSIHDRLKRSTNCVSYLFSIIQSNICFVRWPILCENKISQQKSGVFHTAAPPFVRDKSDTPTIYGSLNGMFAERTRHYILHVQRWFCIFCGKGLAWVLIEGNKTGILNERKHNSLMIIVLYIWVLIDTMLSVSPSKKCQCFLPHHRAISVEDNCPSARCKVGTCGKGAAQELVSGSVNPVNHEIHNIRSLKWCCKKAGRKSLEI